MATVQVMTSTPSGHELNLESGLVNAIEYCCGSDDLLANQCTDEPEVVNRGVWCGWGQRAAVDGK